MKVTFNFDGERLHLYMAVENNLEKAITRLMEAYRIASVQVKYEPYRHGYDDGVAGLDLVLRRPEED